MSAQQFESEMSWEREKSEFFRWIVFMSKRTGVI